ncbi:dephospho-CoA kinase [Spirochaetota bacterium]
MKELMKKCSALTGSIATGKSTVSGMFKELGAHIVDTDLIAREIVQPGQPALDEIKNAFGKEIMNSDGTLNREVMRNIIIDDPVKRQILNSITHPHINSIAYKQAEKYLNSDSKPVIMDIPLLFEVGSSKMFSTIILVHTPVEKQVKQLMKRDGIDKMTAERTIKFQMDIEEKKSGSTYVIDNSGSIENTRKQVVKIYKLLCK